MYQTVVNIHNPNEHPVRLRMKIAVPGLDPSKFVDDSLKPDYAANVDCIAAYWKWYGVLTLGALFLAMSILLSKDRVIRRRASVSPGILRFSNPALAPTPPPPHPSPAS